MRSDAISVVRSCVSHRCSDSQRRRRLHPSGGLDALPQRAALDIGHHVVEERPRLARIVEREHVRVVQPGGNLDFLEEPLGADGRREVGAENLDGDLAGMLPIPCEIDRGHPATAQHPLDVVSVSDGGGEIRRDGRGSHANAPRTLEGIILLPWRRE